MATQPPPPNKPTIKKASEIIVELKKKYIERMDNVLYCQKLFKACAVINWIEQHVKDDETKRESLVNSIAWLDGTINNKLSLEWNEKGEPCFVKSN